MMWSAQEELILVGTRLDENICLHEELNEYDSMIKFFFPEILNSIINTLSFFFPSCVAEVYIAHCWEKNQTFVGPLLSYSQQLIFHGAYWNNPSFVSWIHLIRFFTFLCQTLNG